MKKRIVCLLMALLISTTQIISVSASREDELRQEREATNNQLDATYSKIDSLQEEKEALDAEISQLDQDLVNVMVSLNVLKKDIANKEEKIKETAKKLKKAEAKRDKQYEDMKTRIQYVYENPVDKAWMQVLESDGLSEMLSKAEYTQKMYDYDKESYDEYAATVEKVTDLGNQLKAEKAELEDMKAEQETQQANLESAISQKQAASENYSSEIANAQAQADQYAAILEEQTAEIARLEEERIRAEEEARRQAEAEAAARAAEEAAAQEAAQQQSNDEENDDDSYEAVENTEDTNTEGSGEQETDEYGNVIDSDNTVTDTESSSSDGGSYGSGSGQAVVDFATQFVGNPYVWGGTSLTGGADCSGFVQSVYANFGVSLPRTSESQMYAGTEVSYSDAQPGDLICYGSHIAIYMGGGRIVHASNSAPYPAGGIKISDNAAYRTILSVRRVI
ncbi:MAG: NlpC/P60 family protein [Blautia sp.]|jgi:cell wall-associated NlpC family hydrolase